MHGNIKECREVADDCHEDVTALKNQLVDAKLKYELSVYEIKKAFLLLVADDIKNTPFFKSVTGFGIRSLKHGKFTITVDHGTRSLCKEIQVDIDMYCLLEHLIDLLMGTAGRTAAINNVAKEISYHIASDYNEAILKPSSDYTEACVYAFTKIFLTERLKKYYI